MSLSPRFERYLRHFGPTVPVLEFVQRPDTPNLVALRHDVDYDIDVALETAAWAHKLGSRGTFFILHTAAYWDDRRLVDKCLQIQDFGHEIGLHTNLLTQWYRGEIDNIGATLGKLLDKLRRAGIAVKGVAAHGDPLCYEVGFTNYWLFAELRPDDPRIHERDVTAEGIWVRNSQRNVSYPASGHRLTRPDGSVFNYWSLRLRDFGLTYESSRIACDRYFSDSGGAWKRSPDPLTADLSRGRSLVLMHPIYWRDRQRHYYFLSTARSGSTWLARCLDHATSVTARHEFTLNHRFKDGVLKPAKHTGAGFIDLLGNADELNRLIGEAREWSESLATDYAEANVYLERCVDSMPHDEETIYVHLHRDPGDVVRSLLQRGWYQVPFDDRYPRIDIDGWDHMTQLEQICWYVRDTNRRLAELCTFSIAFEHMVEDPDYLAERLSELGIVVYPRFMREVFEDKLNATLAWDVPPQEVWSQADRHTFNSICGPVREALAYADSHRADQPIMTGTLSNTARDRPRGELPSVQMLSDLKALSNLGGVSMRNCTLTRDDGVPAVRFADHSGYLLLGGGFWHGRGEVPSYLAPAGIEGGLSRPPLGGWWTSSEAIHTVSLGVAFGEVQGTLRLLCLSYDEDFNLIAQRDVGRLAAGSTNLRRHFRTPRPARSFNLALYKAADEGPFSVQLFDFKLSSHSEKRSAAITPGQALDLAVRPTQDAGLHGSHRALITSVEDFVAALAMPEGGSVASWNVMLNIEDGQLVVTPLVPSRPSYLLFGCGTWQFVGKRLNGEGALVQACTWTVVPGDRLRGYIRAKPSKDGDMASVCLLAYDGVGKLAHTIRLGTLTKAQDTVSFDCLLPEGAHWCNVGFAMAVDFKPCLLEAVEIAK
jgi:hypothetical protein